MQQQTGNNIFGTLRFLISFHAVHKPKIRNNAKKLQSTLWFSFIAIISFITTIQCVIEFIFSQHDSIEEMCYIFSILGLLIAKKNSVNRYEIIVVGMFLGATFQSIQIILYKNEILKLFDLLEENYQYTTEIGSQDVNMEGYLKAGKYLINSWFVLLTSGVICLLGSPLFVKNRRVLPLPIWYPYNWQTSPAFECSFFGQIIALCLANYCYTSTETIFPYVSLMIAGQFKILGNNLKNVVNAALVDYGIPKKAVFQFNNKEIDETLQNTSYNDVLNKKFNCYLRQHEILLEICKKLEDTFSFFMLVKIFLSRLYIMTDILCVLYSSNMTNSFPFVIIGCCAFTQLVSFTMFGQIIQTESAEILNKLYKCPWYLCSIQFKRTLLFAQMRAGKTVVLTAGKFFTLNNESLLVFINVVFSYVTLFRQVMDVE